MHRFRPNPSIPPIASSLSPPRLHVDTLSSHRRRQDDEPTCSRPLAAPQPHGLAVLLELGDELVALLDDVLVLLVLVVGPVRLDHALARHAVDCAGDATRGDEFGEVALGFRHVSKLTWTSMWVY